MQAVVIVTGVVVLPLALAYVAVPMPSGRSPARGAGRAPGRSRTVAAAAGMWSGPLLLLPIGHRGYVASEVGVSSGSFASSSRHR